MTPELGEHSSSSKLQSLPAPPQNVAARRQQLELELAPVPRGGSPCLSLEQLFNTEDLPSTYEPLSHTHLDEGPTDQTVKTLFGDLSAERQSRLDGWNASEHSLASSVSPSGRRPPHYPFGYSAAAGPFDFNSVPCTPDGYPESQDGDFSSTASLTHLDWMNSGTFGHGAYSSSSGLTSPTSCYSLDDEWGPSNQASWFGPTGWPPNQTRPSSPGLQMFRTLSLPDAQEGSRRSSLLDPVQAPLSLTQSFQAFTAPQDSSHLQSSCSGYGLDPTTIFPGPPAFALPPSPSPTQISLPPSDTESPDDRREEGLLTDMSSVTLEDPQTTITYGPHLPHVREEEESRYSPSTPRAGFEDTFGMGWEDMKGEGALKTSSSGPRRNGRARRATVSVMEAPMKKKQVSDQDKAPLHWESQTTVATKMAAIARRKQGRHTLTAKDVAAFTRAYNLKGHLRAHEGIRPFACEHPGCEKAFARHHDLKRHAELHLSRFKCGTCKKGFRKIDALKKHYMNEENCIDPYPELDSSNGDLYLAASTPIPAPSVVKGHKKNRSSLGASRRPARVPKFDDDADFTGGF